MLIGKTWFCHNVFFGTLSSGKAIAMQIWQPLVLCLLFFSCAHMPRTARNALKNGDLREAALLLSENSSEDQLPGLWGTLREKRGELGKACELYLKQIERNDNQATDAALLRLARCQAHLGQTDEAVKNYVAVLKTKRFGREAYVLSEAISYLVDHASSDKWIASLLSPRLAFDGKERTIFTLPLELFDKPRRDAMALAYLHLAKKLDHSRHASVAEQAWKMLVIDLPETSSADEAVHDLRFAHESHALSKKDSLRRAKVLLKWNRNTEAIDWVEKKDLVKDGNHERACETKYIVAKAKRQLRDYAPAFAMADTVARHCNGETQRHVREWGEIG